MAILGDALSVLDQAERTSGVLATVEHPVASLLQSYLAERALEAAPDSGLEVKFDQRDILGWVGSFFTWWRRIVKHPWQPPAPQAETVANTLRVGLVGDWGTGLYGAPHCARSMQQDPQRFSLLVHLGDVYYSGTEREVQERFLEFWPRVSGAISRACNSNHEMYAGGDGYFDLTLPRFGQVSSCFALRNDHWLLVGLDTGYQDFDLGMEQVPWLESLVEAAGQRKLILFSHHQPFSHLDKQGVRLVQRLQRLLASRRIFAWYWGHEHRCVLYDAHPLWGLHGRCIGHGGYPYFRDLPTQAIPQQSGSGFSWHRLPGRNLVPGALLLDGPNPHVEGEAERYGLNGYLVLELDGPHLTETFVDADGKELLRERLA